MKKQQGGVSNDIENGSDVPYNPLQGGEMPQVVVNNAGETANANNPSAKRCTSNDKKCGVVVLGVITIVGGVILAGLYGSRCDANTLDMGTNGLKYNISGQGWNSELNPLTYFDHFTYEPTSLDTGATWHNFHMTVYDANGTVIVNNERGSCIGAGHCVALDEYGHQTTDSKLTYNHVVYDESDDGEKIWRKCARSVQVKGYVSNIASTMFAPAENYKEPQAPSNNYQEDFSHGFN